MPETPTKPKRPLTPKQERFVIEYAKDLNATQAARRAGYTGKYVDRYASELLKITRDVLEVRRNAVLARREWNGIASLEQTLRFTTAMAFYDPRKMFDTHGNCKEIPELGASTAKAVAGYEIEELYDGKGESRQKIGYLRKYKLLDRTPYVHMLLKHHGAFPSKQPDAPLAPRGPGGIDWSSLLPEERTALRQQIAAAVAAAVVAQRAAPPSSPGNGHANGHGA